MYKNRVENDRNCFEIPALFYLANEEIQHKTERESSKYIFNFDVYVYALVCIKIG